MKSNNINKSAPLFFLHGWGFDARVWDGFIERNFSDRFTETTNMPGYGVGHEEMPSFSLGDVCRALDKKISSPVLLVGWSLGGQAAIEFASLFPGKVTALILISCSPSFIKRNGWAFGVDPNLIENMKKELLANKEKTLARFCAHLVKGTGEEKANLKILNQLKATEDLSTHALETGLNMLLKEDQRHAFKKLSCPAYMCFGKNDPLIDEHLLDACKKLNQDVSFCLIDKAGHAPFLFAAEKTADWIDLITSRNIN